MINLEQIKLLELKVTNVIDHVKKVTRENSVLKGKLDSYQKRIDELEVLISQFKEEQSRIEDGFLSALDLLNKFEDAVESALSKESTPSEDKKAPEPVIEIENEPRRVQKENKAAVQEPRVNEEAQAAPLLEEAPPAEEPGELDIF
jgi:chromosome segregation ATPase